MTVVVQPPNPQPGPVVVGGSSSRPPVVVGTPDAHYVVSPNGGFKIWKQDTEPALAEVGDIWLAPE